MTPTLGRATCGFAALFMLATHSLDASAVPMTGTDLLTSSSVSFPSTQPRQLGSSLVFEYGTGHGPPRMNLVRFTLADAIAASVANVTATWQIRRLACVGFCAGGATDWDPQFTISDGATMVGFGLGDEDIVNAFSQADLGATADTPAVHFLEHAASLPGIGEALAVTMHFTLGTSGVKARIDYLGESFTWLFSESLSLASLSLVFGQDNDSGERYQVDSLSVDVAQVPEPSTAWLVAAALLLLLTKGAKGANRAKDSKSANAGTLDLRRGLRGFDGGRPIPVPAC